jgi:probable H4MPT-linked C1 transfer pathway protein
VRYTGWDLGGAHLKVAQVDDQGVIVEVAQFACPLWQGIQVLDAALMEARAGIGAVLARHAVTMTGELVDIFSDRSTGVNTLAARMAHYLRDSAPLFYAGRGGLVSADKVEHYTQAIASANWLATAQYLSLRMSGGILLDLGSTTADLVALRDGAVTTNAATDAERLARQELIYTGVVRTPVMAVATQAPFDGEWQGVAAERFATMGDVYRLTGQLTDAMLAHHVQFDAADNQSAAPADCARRLARMLGRDASDAEPARWMQLAHYFARRQRNQLVDALERLRSRTLPGLPLIGAGIGRFVVRDLAAAMGHDYIDFSDCVEGDASWRDYAAVCAPATALAYLLRAHSRDPLHAR